MSTAFGCPYEGDVAPERVAQVAGHLLDAGADRLSFGDTTGMATPRRVDDLLDSLERAGISLDRVGLHFHNTRGTALANILAGLERGITHYDASIGGLGGCPYAPGASGNKKEAPAAAPYQTASVAVPKMTPFQRADSGGYTNGLCVSGGIGSSA